MPPTYSMATMAILAEVLNIANHMHGDALYAVTTIGQSNAPVSSYSGLTLLPDCTYEDQEDYDWVIICGSQGSAHFEDHAVFNWLRRLDRKGAILGAVTSGAWILARAGLLDGHKCTLHWYDKPGFQEEFPDIQVTGNLYERDRRRITCVGGIVGLDMILYLIAQVHGERFAQKVNQHMVNDRIRAQDSHWSASPSARDHIRNPKVAKAMELMETHLEDPLTLGDIAELVATSPRQLARLFTQHLGQSAQSHYLQIRLHHARDLLDNTRLSLQEIAIASGFSSATRFGQAFKNQFEQTPMTYRKNLKR